ncbi:MAG TPA: hypothetical protein VGM30_15075 [Puia sp.]
MKKKRHYSCLFIFCMLLVFGKTRAQGVFSWQANVDSTTPIKADGFYQILLTPEVLAKCKADLSDVRILGADNRFVSYVLKDSLDKNGEPEYMAIPGAVITQKDSSNKHTYIYLQFPEAYETDWVAFMIRDPAFYRREALVSAEGAHPDEWTEAAKITILPHMPMYRLPTLKTRRLRIDIDNADNAPLLINDVGCLQLSHCLLAYLKAGMDYKVVAGDVQAAAPDYDLRYFTDSLKTTPPSLLLGGIKPASIINTDRAKPAPPPAGKVLQAPADGNHNGILLWSIIILVLLLLIYLSVKLAKAIPPKDEQDRL